ncbi:low molecular weight protein-tyrosine-phosphatase [Cellulomonas xiejunii]|uniref:protein-tyrosine-phosphatase n=1 Tax=Cellulomonas xiejunii TaxID=2968083 RepID=A0ABY5KS38_9CELL|nr:low molecular weight protein-tyrosine-phosphatase [Cellulomonas xiejunii]MCC2313438.1 low molecular weight phosphotyrosine protein phosphatase [Cellulomonas xiejunii]MCC2321395.1 low molecular weight phosphotyrosine protein phosphatase [Cellulomonas xiejunii]UUI71976.1 low molecular weight phosphotyrosine protein phosphatase [Cellulomonas xiejunii]
MPHPYRVMTVCTGNICRSPMAEVVLRERFAAAGLADAVEVDSTGISDEERGNPVDWRARSVLRRHGYPTGEGHRARQILPEHILERDLVLPMTATHARALRRLTGGDPAATSRIRMYRSFDPAAPAEPGQPEHVLDVDDPWYGPEEGFETTLAEIEAAADGIVAHVREALDYRNGLTD